MPRTCREMHIRVMAGERHGNGMVCENQTRPHCVNQMGKTQSKPLAERHGRGTACYVWIRLKRHRILPFFELSYEPNATCYLYVYDHVTARTEQSLNYDPLQIHARLLCHTVFGRSTGRLEPEMFQSSKLCSRLAGRKPERVNEAY
jgi:hypothetical protein